MHLQDYLNKRKLTLAQFAAEIGVSVPAVHRYVWGDRIPSREIMARIAEATGGKVKPNDFYAPPTTDSNSKPPP